MKPAEQTIAYVMRRRLVHLFPECFAGRRKAKRPLQNNILDEIVWRCPDIDREGVRLALIDYCNGEKYLTALVSGAARIDLDGNVVGCVTSVAAERAAMKLSRQRAHNERQDRLNGPQSEARAA